VTPATKKPRQEGRDHEDAPKPNPRERSAATHVSASPPPTVPDPPFTSRSPRRAAPHKDGISYTKDFDVKFLKAQRELLEAERTRLLGQATRLEDEANQLIEEGEMGDVQFDDEGGEGDTMVVERERDLALSSQARQTIADIDARSPGSRGTYGYSVVSGRADPARAARGDPVGHRARRGEGRGHRPPMTCLDLAHAFLSGRIARC
jgi:RNA polymerase-binding transcription factor DksA